MTRRQRGLQAGLLAMLGVLVAGALWLGMSVRLDPSALCIPTTRVVDRNGRQIHAIVDAETGFCEPLDLASIPKFLQQAVVATEDARFFQHHGVDPVGLARALWLNARSGGIVAGGSTITQQVARMLVLGRDACYDQSLDRKLHEMALALRLEAQFSKKEILELYLNQSYWGDLAYGAQAASRAVFGKPVAQLDLAECALLAGMLQGPEYYDPFENKETTLARQRVVLGLMAKQGMITPSQAAAAAAEKLCFEGGAADSLAPHVGDLIERELPGWIGEDALASGGLCIETTLDSDLQRYARDQAIQQLEILNRVGQRENGETVVDNAAVLVVDVATGGVLAMVGSPDFDDERIDGQVNACITPRQPGSALKPFTYALAFEQGYSPATVVADVRTSYITREGQPYVPVNYDYQFHGPVSLRTALACSYNTVAVAMLDQVGLDAWSARMREIGFTTLADTNRHGLALTLGSGEVSLLELTAAYACLANEGRRVDSYLVERVLDSSGRVLYSHRPTDTPQVFDPRIAFLVSDVLADDAARAPSFGEQSVLAQPFAASVKTGTTTDWRDNWTVGYTPDTVVGVWVGNADNRPMRNITGVDGAAPIWHAVLGRAHDAEGGDSHLRPPGLIQVQVCADSGMLAGDACPHKRNAWFIAESVPTEICDTHAWVSVDMRSGLLADNDCPSHSVRQVTARRWDPGVLPWAIDHELVSDVELQLARDGAGLSQRRAREGPADPNLPRILYPDAGAEYTLSADIPRDAQQILIQVAGDPASDVLDLLIDGEVYCSWHRPPYGALWSLAPGAHVFQAEQQGDDGTLFCSEPVTIRILGPAAQAPRERTGS